MQKQDGLEAMNLVAASDPREAPKRDLPPTVLTFRILARPLWHPHLDLAGRGVNHDFLHDDTSGVLRLPMFFTGVGRRRQARLRAHIQSTCLSGWNSVFQRPDSCK